jgi:hypothetical protein
LAAQKDVAVDDSENQSDRVDSAPATTSPLPCRSVLVCLQVRDQPSEVMDELHQTRRR